jgi:hypothetical protein
VILRLKKKVASGAATTRIAADHRSDIATGCCIGQAWTAPDGLGSAHRTLAAATTALTGFQVAIACSQPGMCWVGTIALDKVRMAGAFGVLFANLFLYVDALSANDEEMHEALTEAIQDVLTTSR